MKNIIICSKENPIRILNGKTRNDILKTYIIRNQVEEIINPVCLKIDQTVILLFNYNLIDKIFQQKRLNYLNKKHLKFFN